MLFFLWALFLLFPPLYSCPDKGCLSRPVFGNRQTCMACLWPCPLPREWWQGCTQESGVHSPLWPQCWSYRHSLCSVDELGASIPRQPKLSVHLQWCSPRKVPRPRNEAPKLFLSPSPVACFSCSNRIPQDALCFVFSLEMKRLGEESDRMQCWPSHKAAHTSRQGAAHLSGRCRACFYASREEGSVSPVQFPRVQ